jgi:hypothetical protein
MRSIGEAPDFDESNLSRKQRRGSGATHRKTDTVFPASPDRAVRAQ